MITREQYKPIAVFCLIVMLLGGIWTMIGVALQHQWAMSAGAIIMLTTLAFFLAVSSLVVYNRSGWRGVASLLTPVVVGVGLGLAFVHFL